MHYCMSDIHGQYDLFIKMLKKINLKKDDYLFILGDVIDRGKDGIKIIQYIIDKPNIFLLIGNHEHMMLNYYRYKESRYLSLWMINGGEPTKDAFEKLSASEQEEILEYLKNCPLVIPKLVINNKSFYLTHAAPINRKNILFYDEAMLFDIEDAVWTRSYAKNPQYFSYLARFKGYYVLFGHTPIPKLDYRRLSNSWKPLISRYNKYVIAIDCGCAYIGGNSMVHGQLGCICLDDFKEFYVF